MTTLTLSEFLAVMMLYMVAAGHFLGLLAARGRIFYHALGVAWPMLAAIGLEARSTVMLIAGSVVYCVYLGALWTEGK
jgi:hypothetical protein